MRLTNLLSTREKDDRLGEEMGLDEAPQHVQLLIQFDDHVVLLQILRRRCGTRFFLLPLSLCISDDSFSHRDVFRVLERETSEVLDRFRLRRREKKRLSRFGEICDNSVDRCGESHVEDTIRFVEYYTETSGSRCKLRGRVDVPRICNWSHSNPSV